MENMQIWNDLFSTDPSHTKNFQRAGGFKGTAVKPMWSYMRLTEKFGPFGKGWGVSSQDFQIVDGGNEEKLIFCTVNAFYVIEDEKYHIVGVGGDKITSKQKSGYVFNDDEAFKKAFTDALTNAFKMIGVGGDIHMGLFDDSKYVNAVKAEFEQSNNQPQQNNNQPDNKPQEKPRLSKNEEAREIFTTLQDQLHELTDDEQIKSWWSKSFPLIKRLPDDWELDIRGIVANQRQEIQAKEKEAA